MAERIDIQNIKINDVFFITYDSYFDTKKPIMDERFSLVGFDFMASEVKRSFDGASKSWIQTVTLKQVPDNRGNSYRSCTVQVLPRGLCRDIRYGLTKEMPSRYYEIVYKETFDDEDVFFWELAGKNTKVGDRK